MGSSLGRKEGNSAFIPDAIEIVGTFGWQKLTKTGVNVFLVGGSVWDVKPIGQNSRKIAAMLGVGEIEETDVKEITFKERDGLFSQKSKVISVRLKDAREEAKLLVGEEQYQRLVHKGFRVGFELTETGAEVGLVSSLDRSWGCFFLDELLLEVEADAKLPIEIIDEDEVVFKGIDGSSRQENLSLHGTKAPEPSEYPIGRGKARQKERWRGRMPVGRRD